jgi:aspartate ammonia-lyase
MSPRLERDPLGEKPVPDEAYYGIQTLRAVENFPISGLRMPPDLVTATVVIKKCAAEANVALGRLAADVGQAIIAAADEVIGGRLRDQFVVDVYQAGAGTSHHMNVNEVLANRAGELLGAPRGSYTPVHPNDHVNMGQSTNDVFPTATRLALLTVKVALVAAARALADVFDANADVFRDILKVGRTHLQDAVPMTLGQEMGGYAACIRRGADDVEAGSTQLLELNLGATALGTGLNAGEDFTTQAVAAIARETGFAVVPAANRFRVTQSMGDVLAFSGAVRRLAIEVNKVASDLRLLSMGPRAGLGEIRLPAVQPGSSIMPGKVNPSVPEMVNQVCFQVLGCDQTVAAAADAGQLELNVMMPVIAYNSLHAASILAQALTVLRTRTVEGLEADRDRCRELLDRSTAVATALSPYLGYATTAEIAKAAVASNRSIREIVLERGLMPADRLDRVLAPAAMTEPGMAGSDPGGSDPFVPPFVPGV